MNRQVFDSQYSAYAFLHIVSGAAGGAAATLAAWALARTVGLGAGTNTAWALSISIVAFAVLVDSGRLRVRIPSTGQQVPADWRHTLPRPAWVSAFGALLGFTYLTRFSASTVPASLLAIGIALPIPIAAGLGASYGIARTSAVLGGATTLKPDWQSRYDRFASNSIATIASLLIIASLAIFLIGDTR